MTSARELLMFAVEMFRVKVGAGEDPTFAECLRESLHVHEPERYAKPEPQYKVVGKLGTWVHHGCQGERYLDVGLQDKPEYRVIRAAQRDSEHGYYFRVFLERHGEDWQTHGANTNVYEKRK